MKNSNSLFCLIAMALAPAMAQAAILTAVPMQGGMVMPMLSYHADDGMLHVMLDPTVPQLTPLLVSNPADRFDPADPWFDALDPSRQGLAFSRRYGFVMDTVTDLLPAGTGIRIRKLSGSAQLGFYRAHGMSLPHLWEPIFGTFGTTNEFSWSGTMFHPCVTAPPGTNAFSATFEAFLFNTTTGQEVANSSTDPFVFNWTNVPDGRPTLDIARRIVIFCPASATDYVLEGTETLSNGTWTPVTNAPLAIEGQSAVVLEPGETRTVFRMKRNP